MKATLIKVVMSLSVVLAAGLGVAGTASAQTATAADCSYGCATVPTIPSISSGSGTTTAVAPSTDGTPAATTPADGATALAATSSTSLAFTGTDIGGTIGIGVVLVGGGIVMVRLGRRKRQD